jgi:hypothetical protein
MYPLATDSHGLTGKEQSPFPATATNLKPTVQRFLAAIKGGKPLDLLPFWSDDGVAFGIDGDPVSKAAFQKDVERKGCLYCFFFDTDGLRKRDDEMRQRAKAQPRDNPLYSYKELLVKFMTDAVEVSQHREAGIIIGNVRVPLENEKPSKSKTQTELRFTFSLEHDAWRLTAVEYN